MGNTCGACGDKNKSSRGAAVSYGPGKIKTMPSNKHRNSSVSDMRHGSEMSCKYFQ